MGVPQIEKWWKRADHRKIKGARGARFAGLGMHFVFFLSIGLLIEWVFRSTDGGDETYRLPPPPVKAPPPLERSLSYTLTSEMPHLRSLEIEDQKPEMAPPRDSLNYVKLRSTGKLV